ncbi:hypothetical protein VTK73DRAFT_5716 [Phialemonium thermophilum]|uniref:C2H2-type domain-containing protein n=1 Tax=Phialemonium thermophilum TaxID=223376 RepID=A0ABR3XWY9_9PEZI
MFSNPRRNMMTPPESKVNASPQRKMCLKKGTTFHGVLTPPPSPETDSLGFRPPSLPRRSHTNLDDVIDSHRRRAALTLGTIDKVLKSTTQSTLSSASTAVPDDRLPVPRGILDQTILSDIMSKDKTEVKRCLSRERSRQSTRHHESDSGLGTSVASTRKKHGGLAVKNEKPVARGSALTKSVTPRTSKDVELPALSARATNRIFEHTLKPLLSQPSFKDFHPLVLECPRKIQQKEIVCLRDVEKTLLLLAPERSKAAKMYLNFCLATIQCVQATVEYLNEREQTRPRDPPYTGGYFIDLVDQITRYAAQLADAKAKGDGQIDDMAIDPTDEIKLHGGIHINGRPAELVRVKKNGKAISMATGEPVEIIEEEPPFPPRIKRSASQELEDEEAIMRSMARRKKNASPEELAPKKCREPGCNKEFKRPCDLTKHEKTHSRPWKCPVPTCKYHEYGWPTEKEMARHQNDKHSENPAMYECLFKPCPYKSKRDSNRKQHMEKAHGWKYVRSKTNNGKRDATASLPDANAVEPSPQAHHLPSPPISDQALDGVSPPQGQMDFMFGDDGTLEFPTYDSESTLFDVNMIPQDITLDSPITNNTSPSAESIVDYNSSYDISEDFTLGLDIYSAHARVPIPTHNLYEKGLPLHGIAAVESANVHAFHPDGVPAVPPHMSPTGRPNQMLYTPTSMVDVDEGFDDYQDFGNKNAFNNADFVLYPNDAEPKPDFANSLFLDEVPSLVAGYPQPNSQEFLNDLATDWQGDYRGPSHF